MNAFHGVKDDYVVDYLPKPDAEIEQWAYPQVCFDVIEGHLVIMEPDDPELIVDIYPPGAWKRIGHDWAAQASANAENDE